MRVLVVGGAASGKSAFAERAACALSESRTYAATMAEHGDDARARIRRHRQMRAGLGFRTVECLGTLEPLAADDGVVLVDDLGNLVAGALFAPAGVPGWRQVTTGLEAQLLTCCERFAHVVAVGCDVGRDGCRYGRGTDEWMRSLGSLQCVLAARFDVVVEVVCGVPVVVKGDLAWLS